MGEIQIIATPEGDEMVVLDRVDYKALVAALKAAQAKLALLRGDAKPIAEPTSPA